MFDVISLWIGRIILGFLGAFCTGYFLYSIRFVFRRPYYCVKHLLPWKWWSDEEWQITKDKVNKKHFDTESKEWMNRIKMYRYGKHLGVIKDFGIHRWWEPTYRFFWIKS